MQRSMKNVVGFLLVILAIAVARPRAQSISVTFPARVAAAPDFATEVLGDPWDMCSAQDISPDPNHLIGFSSFTFSTGPCRAGGTTMAVNGGSDSSLVLLNAGIWDAALNPGK